MERGLMWLPLLALFSWLAWAGRNEFQKVEAYRQWAEGSDRAKYDIYAMLCQRGSELTWGKPSRNGPLALQQCSIDQITTLALQIGSQHWSGAALLALDPAQLPPGRPIALQLTLAPSPASPDRPPAPLSIPFTETALALQWAQWLQTELDNQSLDNQSLDNPSLDSQSLDNQSLSNPSLDSQNLDSPSLDNPSPKNPSLEN